MREHIKHPAGHAVLMLVMLAVAVLAGELPAAADTGIIDPCGDAESHAYGLGDEIVVEDGLGHVDIADGGVTPILDDEEEAVVLGLEATVEVCGEASADEGAYGISWGIGDGCVQQVGWTLLVRDDVSAATRRPGQDEIDVATGPRPIFQEYCFVSTPKNPVRSNEVQTVFRMELPADAVSFDGSRLTFTVANELVPDAGTVPSYGDVFARPTLLTMDQTVSAYSFGGGSNTGPFGASVRTDLASGADVELQ